MASDLNLDSLDLQHFGFLDTDQQETKYQPKIVKKWTLEKKKLISKKILIFELLIKFLHFLSSTQD